MNQRLVIASALASVMALGLASGAQAAEKAPKEKCYGIAKAGQNDCSSGAHSCAGQAKEDNAPTEWKYVAKGSCKELGGKTESEAKGGK